MKSSTRQFASIYLLTLLAIIGLAMPGAVRAAVITSAQDGNWSSTTTWVGGAVPTENDSVVINHTVTLDQNATTTGISINSGGKLRFDTTTGRILTINDDGDGSLLTVGASGSAGTLECRSPSSGTNTIVLNATSTNASVGIEVESQGVLDFKGNAPEDRDCLIRAFTEDGSLNGYLYLKSGSEAVIQNTEIRYLGANLANKYGIYAESVNLGASGEGLIISGSKIHNNYIGIIASSTKALIAKNDIFSNSNDGIKLINSSNTTLRANLIYDNGLYNIELQNADANYIFNNTIDGSATSDDGIFLDSNSSSNQIKNNIITNHTNTAKEGIDDDGASNTVDYNLFYNNTSDGSIGTNSITAQDPLFEGATDFDLQANSPALGAGVDLKDGTVPGTINMGAILGYVKNITDNQEFSYLQQANDAAGTSAGDTIIAYTRDEVSDTIAGNITQISSASSTMYQIRFDVAEATVIADNDYEGMYAYFTSGLNRGRYYLIVDSDENITDTLTILSEQASTTFTVGDGFTIVDRVYARLGNAYHDTNLVIGYNKDGTATAPITWTTNGTVIIDPENIRARGIYIYYSDYQIIDGFIVLTNKSGGGVRGAIANDNSYYNIIRNNFIYRSNQIGIRSYQSSNLVVENNFVLETIGGKTSTTGIAASQNSLIASNTIIDASGRAIASGDNSLVIDNTVISAYNNGINLDDGVSFVGNRFMNTNNTGKYYGVVYDPGTSNTRVFNNVLLAGKKNGIQVSAGSNIEIYNNIIVDNSYEAIRDNSGGTAVIGNNLCNGNGTGDANCYASSSPNFYFEISSTADASGNSTTVLVDTSLSAMTENKYAGYAVYFDGTGTGGTCNVTAGTWVGIFSNTANRFFLEPALNASPDYCNYKVTNFYVMEDSPALGAGADVMTGNAGQCSGVNCVNIGARLGFVKNNQGTSATSDDNVYNWMQSAHDDASLDAGDTVTVYAMDQATSTFGATITDIGPSLTIDMADETLISADHDYVGFYLYMTSGLNRGKYYLIIESDERTAAADGTDIDTISIVPTDGTADFSTTGFNEGDGFTIVDRVYDKEGYSSGCPWSTGANLCISKDGSATSPITWNTNGTVIVDKTEGSGYSIGVKNGQYNIIDGFVLRNGTAGVYLHDNSGFPYAIVRNNTIADVAEGIHLKGGSIAQSNTVYRASSGGIYTGGNVANQNTLTIDNIILDSSGSGIALDNDSRVFNNILIDNRHWSGNLAHSGGSIDNSVIRGNIVLGGDKGIYTSNYDNASFLNNTIIGATTDGILIQSGGTGHIIRNNIVAFNGDDGLDDINGDYTVNTYDFNVLYGNADLDYSSSDVTPPVGNQGANTLNVDPNFYFEVSTGVATGTTSYVDLSGTQNWTHNQFVGYGLTFTGASCPAAVLNKWFGVITNTSEKLFYKPTPSSAPDTNCTANLTQFYLSSTTSTSTPLGQGAAADGTTEPGTVNIGARLGYVYNSDLGKKYNRLQSANDDSSLVAGHTITTYAVDEIASGTIGATITDNGPFITVDVDDNVVTSNDQWSGFYLYLTSGANKGKYYLIIDSAEAATDTISLYASSTTGFAQNDTFKIIDRIYNEKSHLQANFNLTKSGSSVSNRINWTASGTVVVDADQLSYNIYDDPSLTYCWVCGYNLLNYSAQAVAGNATYAYDSSSNCYCWPSCNSQPTNDSLDLLNHDDGEEIYAGSTYTWQVQVSDSDGYTNLDTVTLHLDYDGDDQTITWDQTTDSFSESSPYFSDANSTSSCSGNTCTLNFKLTMGWNWENTDDTPTDVKLVTVDDASSTDTDVYLTDTFQLENDLDFTGTLTASGWFQGSLASGDWVRGEETITWSGLTVVYENTTTSPSESDFDIQITDDDGNSWTQTSGTSLNLQTTADSTTDTQDIHNIDIINIPTGGSDVSNQTFTIKVDADPPTGATLSVDETTISSIRVKVSGAVDADSGLHSLPYWFEETSVPDSSGWQTSVSWTDSGLSPNTQYTYKVKVRDAVGNQSSFSNALTASTLALPGVVAPADWFAPPKPPTGGFQLLINNGAKYTDSPIVALDLVGGPETARMEISNNPEFTGSDSTGQIPYQSSYQWNLCQGKDSCSEGEYTVYAKFFTAYGRQSEAVSDSIIYQKQLPQEKTIPRESKPPTGQVAELPPSEAKPSAEKPKKSFIEKGPKILKPLVPKFLKPKPPKNKSKEEIKPKVPLEKLAPKQIPLVFQGKWQLLPAEATREFVLAPFPRELKMLVEKFPRLRETLEKFGITKVTDIKKLKAVKLTLPGLTKRLGLPSTPKAVPVAELSTEIKERLPTDVVFAKISGGLIDLNFALSITEKGEVQKRIKTISDKPLQLVVKPDKPVKSIKGYVVFRQKGITKYESGIENKSSLIHSSNFTIQKEKRLVLLEFEYTDQDGDGIYTAEIQTPKVEGEYEVITAMDFKDPELEKKEVSLIALIDPEGYIYEKIGDKEIRIPGAIVSLFWLNPETKQYELWPAKEYQQKNPQITDATGRYSFLVPEGYYYLKVEASGYLGYVGKSFQVKDASGVHINIELKPKYWWLKIIDWRTILLIVVTILLLYNFYRDKIHERIMRNEL